MNPPSDKLLPLKRYLGLLVLLAGASPLPQSMAGLLRLESNSIFATYRGDDLAADTPLMEFFETHYADETRHLRFSANFGLRANMSRSSSDFSLYALDGAYDVVPGRVKVTLGRSFKTFSTIRPSVMDSGEVEVFLLEKRLSLGAYAGVERKFEYLGSSERKSASAGCFGTYRTSSFLPLTAGARVAHFDYGDAGTADLLALSANQPLSGPLSPELLASSELSLSSLRLNRLEVGADFYPDYKTSLGLRGLTYDLSNPQGPNQSIFSVFSQGRLNELSLRAGYLFSRAFSASLSVSFDRFVLDQGQFTNGGKAELGFGYGNDVWRLNHFTYYVGSYGGRALGDKVVLNWKVDRRFDAFGLVDYVAYEKVTSSRRSALSAQIGASTWVWNSFRLDLGGEFNNNNSNRSDFRFFSKLTYLLWRET